MQKVSGKCFQHYLTRMALQKKVKLRQAWKPEEMLFIQDIKSGENRKDGRVKGKSGRPLLLKQVKLLGYKIIRNLYMGVAIMKTI